MKLNTEPIKNWFGFSRRERRSSFTLLVIILFILGVRYTLPPSAVTIEELTGTFGESDLSLKDSIESGSYLFENSQGDRYYHKRPTVTATKGVPPVRVRRTDGSGGYNEPQRQPIDINSSDSATLVKLPGIGPVLSARIIKYRNFLGGYARIDQLKEVYGLPEETFEAIKGRVVADTLFIRKTNINTAEYKEISRIPYLEKYEVSSILKYREISGRINNLQELTGNKILSPEKAAKMGVYLKYD
jgi:DNA uptake protein ComE-like DNA-binding protein